MHANAESPEPEVNVTVFTDANNVWTVRIDPEVDELRRRFALGSDDAIEIQRAVDRIVLRRLPGGVAMSRDALRELAVELVGGPRDGENALIEDRCDEPGCDCSIVGGVIDDDNGSVYRIVRCEHGHVLGLYEGQRNAA